MTLLESFARTKRLKVKRDESGDVVVVGKLGQLYQHGDGLVGLVLMSPSGDDPKLDNTLRSRMRKALQTGLELHQQGDCESSFLFDPENKQQARLAIRLVGAMRKRRASPAQLRNLRRGPDRRPHSAPESTIPAEMMVGVGV